VSRAPAKGGPVTDKIWVGCKSSLAECGDEERGQNEKEIE